MKWIKTFEELKPDTYRRAGNKLISIGHGDRGGSLVDFSYEKESGLYNMFLASDNSKYGPKDKTYSFSFSDYEIAYSGDHEDLEKCLESWKNKDSELDIEIIFYFKPTYETKKSLDSIYKKDKYSLFSIKYTLAINDEDEDEEFDLSELYEQNEWLSLRTECTDKFLYGIFSDKKSASLFIKNVLPGVIESAKEKLADLYSAIGVPTEYYENCINGFKYITNNHLYRTSLKDNLGNNLIGFRLYEAMYCTILENIHER